MSNDREFRCRVSKGDATEFPDATINATALTEEGEEIVRIVREAVTEAVE